MESKIIEYGIMLLHKSKVEQTEVISRLIFTFCSQITTTFGQIYIFLKHFHSSLSVAVSRVQKIFIQSHFESEHVNFNYPRFPGKSKNRLNLSLLPFRAFASSQQFFFSVRRLIQSETSTKQLLLEYRQFYMAVTYFKAASVLEDEFIQNKIIYRRASF